MGMNKKLRERFRKPVSSGDIRGRIAEAVPINPHQRAAMGAHLGDIHMSEITSTLIPGNRGRAATRKSVARTSPADPGEAVKEVTIEALQPATVNHTIYKPVRDDDSEIIDLAKSVKKYGLIHPIVVTLDNVIISGHRRHRACRLAGLARVKVLREAILSTDPGFEGKLVEANRQRVKSPQESIREEIVRTSPTDAHNALLAHRVSERAKRSKQIDEAGLRVLKEKAAARRSGISEEKRGMLDAAVAVVEQYRDYWPLTLRQIHYRLLTRSVLRNARTGLKYDNSQKAYKDLSDLLSRARLEELVPWESMHDPTRPRTEWEQWNNVGEYMRGELDSFLCGYHRDLLQSQPAYVELVVEKITVQEIAERAAYSYRVPVGVGRGYASVTALEETAARFFASGKDEFVLLIASDLDPEGENISETWGACLRDEHGVENLKVVKVGVNPEQVAEYGLSPLPVKDTSSRAAGYTAEHGESVYELEAFEPSVLQQIIRDAIRKTLDMEMFAKERERESEDARSLMAYRRRTVEMFKELDLELDLSLDDAGLEEDESSP